MKKTTYLKTLLVALCLLGGASFAWADDTTFEKDAIIGSKTEPGGWWYATSNVIDIPKNKTLILKFKTYSATDEQLAGKGENGANLAWGSYMSHILRIGYQKSSANNDIYDLRWRADGYGWVEGNGTTSDNPSPSWLVYNGSNTRWGTDGAEFREDITGSTVTLTIQRFGTELRIAQDIAATSGNYRKYLVVSTGYEGFMWAQIVLERAYIEVLENANTVNSEDALTGTLIGKLNRTGRLADHGAKVDFTLAPDESLNLKFKSYNNHIATWGTWLVELQHGGDYYDVVSGNKGNSWGTLKVAESVSTSGYPATDAAILDALDGATVDLTVSRSGAQVDISATITPISGDEMTLTSSITPTKEGFASSDITVRPLVELGYIDLLPVTKEITSAGWATYCSPYALDFSGDIANLEKAYLVTGNTGAKLDLSEIIGTIPANTGILLEGNGTVSIPIVGSSSTDVSTNKLIGKTAAYNLAAGGGYVLMKETAGVGFYKNTYEFTVGANTAYLPDGFGTGYARSFFSFDDEETTSVNELKTTNFTNNTNEVFDLQGRRVAQPTKGLYIVNGKKVVIK